MRVMFPSRARFADVNEGLLARGLTQRERGGSVCLGIEGDSVRRDTLV